MNDTPRRVYAHDFDSIGYISRWSEPRHYTTSEILSAVEINELVRRGLAVDISFDYPPW